MKQKRGTILIAVLLIALLCESAFLLVSAAGQHGSGMTGDGAWYPSLPIQGDVSNTAEILFDGGEYRIKIGGETESAEQQTFDFEEGKHRGILLSHVLEETGLYTEASHIYFVGRDGMMSSLNAKDLEKNYILFGPRGWEVMNVDYPASSNVKELAYIAAVADNPSNVDPSVTVTVKDEGGYDRTVSPGTLLLMESHSGRKYHGQSEKSGKKVIVFTTDTWVSIGEHRLQAEGNRIVELKE